MPAQAQSRGEPSTVQEASQRGIRGIAVRVGIEPENGPADGCQTTKGSDRGVAIPAQDHWELAGSTDCAHGDGDAPHEFEGSTNLRWPLIRVSLNHLNVRNGVSPILEVCGEPGLEQVLRTGTTAPSTPAVS